MRITVGVALLLGMASVVGAENRSDALQGAQALLAGLAAQPKSGDANLGGGDAAQGWRKSRDAPASVQETELQADIAAFGRGPLNAAGAGTKWAQLFDRWFTLRHPAEHSQTYRQETSLSGLMAVLPPPSSWASIAAALRRRYGPDLKATPELDRLAVLAFADQLAGDTPGLRKRRDQIASIAEKSSEPGNIAAWRARNAAKDLDEALQAREWADPVKRFIELAASPVAAPMSLQVPDLVTLVGVDQAREVLRKALAQSNSLFEFHTGEATRMLAAEIALQEVDRLRLAQWNLVRGLDCAALYEAMTKRFGKHGAASGMLSQWLSAMGLEGSEPSNVLVERARSEAAPYYFAALIAHGRGSDAEGVVQEMGSDLSDYQLQPIFDALSEAGFDKEAYAFLDGFLARHSNSSLWKGYLELAARTGQQDAMLAHVRATIAKPEAKGDKSALRTHLIDALLAADKLDEAVDEMQAIFEDGAASEETRGLIGLKLAELGRLYERADWIERGLAADAGASAGKPAARSSTLDSDEDRLAQRLKLLRRLQRYADEERNLIRTRTSRAASDANFKNSSKMLTELVGIYHDVGRDADIVTLLDKYPQWDAADVAEVYRESDVRKIPLGYYVAAAMHRRGRDDVAVPLLEAVIDAFGGFDAAYELYAQIRGPAAAVYFDKVYARDQFEERPLIWKAVLLLKSNHPNEAERVARAAIAVDPSDGEEGPGDRLRAYAVLADIVAAQGDAEQAQTLRNAVEAIRESEHADEFRLAGLHTHAIALYTHALERFADAYCIQSRLAVELNANGNSLMAQEHYRRAYELMPSSFGRMESHCLGCENVFGGNTAQGIAETVFGNLAKSMPANPQVHYLLGYLRDQQRRYVEALAEYKIAASLDPDYLNAWKKQYQLGEKINMPGAELDRITLHVFALDPQGRHTYVRTEKVADWPALYTLAANAAAKQRPAHANIYALKASKSVQDAHASPVVAERRKMLATMRSLQYAGWQRGDLNHPGSVIAKTELMSVLAMRMGGAAPFGDLDD